MRTMILSILFLFSCTLTAGEKFTDEYCAKSEQYARFVVLARHWKEPMADVLDTAQGDVYWESIVKQGYDTPLSIDPERAATEFGNNVYKDCIQHIEE